MISCMLVCPSCERFEAQWKVLRREKVMKCLRRCLRALPVRNVAGQLRPKEGRVKSERSVKERIKLDERLLKNQEGNQRWWV